MIETLSSIAFILLIVILVAIFLPTYLGWVIGGIVSVLLFDYLGKKK